MNSKHVGGTGSSLPDGRAITVDKYEDGNVDIKIWVAGGYYLIDAMQEPLTKPGQEGMIPLLRATWHKLPDGAAV